MAMLPLFKPMKQVKHCIISNEMVCMLHLKYCTVPTSAPLGLRVNATASHSLVLAWELPPLEDRNGRIRQYQVRLTEIETGDILQLVSTSTQVNVSNLHPFYNYNCSVAAETIAVGPFSDAILVRLDEYSTLPPSTTYSHAF